MSDHPSRRSTDRLPGRARRLGGLSAVGAVSLVVGAFLGITQAQPYTPWAARADINANRAALARHEEVGHTTSTRRLDAVAWQTEQLTREISELKEDVKALRAEIRELIRESRRP